MPNQNILIDYPMKLSDTDKVEYKITDGKLFCFVDNNVNFKKINFKKVDCDFLVVVGTGENIKVEKIKSMYVLDSPIDFIPDILTTSFYNNFFDSIFTTDREKFFNYVNGLVKTSKAGYEMFEEFNPAVINTIGNFKNYNFRNFESKNKKKEKYSYKFDEEIPVTYKEVQYNFLKQKYKNEFEKIMLVFKDIFEKNKISSAKDILRRAQRKLKTYSANQLKPFIPLNSYYYITGPFRNQWVAYGYDVRKNKKYFKFQYMPIRTGERYRRIYEHKKIHNLIENNREKYLNEKCEYENGFLNREAVAKIKNILEEEYINETTKEVDDTDMLFFDLKN